jgi:hypothetical protein
MSTVDKRTYGSSTEGVKDIEEEVTRSLVLCVCFADHCLSLFFGHCDLLILITPLVSSNSS